MQHMNGAECSPIFQCNTKQMWIPPLQRRVDEIRMNDHTEVVEQLELSYPAGENVKSGAALQKFVWPFP